MQVMLGGVAREINGRVGAMVRYLVENQEQINRMPKGRVEFNCAGKSVRPKVEIAEDEVKVHD